MSTSTKIIILSTLPLLLAACNKETVLKAPAEGRHITIGVDMAETRALMRPSDVTKEGAKTALTVYGYEGNGTAVFNGYTATPPSGQQSTTKVSNWDIKVDGSGTSLKPEWKDDTDYTFFSWTKMDASGVDAATFLGCNYSAAVAATATEDAAPAKLTIAEKELEITTENMDFCYSNVVTRSANSPDYSMVRLNLEHLFAAFSLSAHNYTDGPVTITSVVLKNFHNKKSAVITFSTDPEEGARAEYTTSKVIGTTTPFTTDQELISDASGVSLAAGKSMENIAKGSGSTAKYFLMWPQTADELAGTDLDTASPGGSYLEVKYKIGSTDKTVYLELPKDDDNDGDGIDDGWPAGVCQNMELSFTQRTLSLTVKPAPWNQTEPVYDYEGAATVSESLTLVSGFVNPSGTKNVFFESTEPIILKFKIDAPLNASWMVERIGDTDAFEIDNITPGTGTGVAGDGIDTREGVIDGIEAVIAISPKVTDPQRDYKMQLSFTARCSNGTVIDINGITATTGVQGGTDKSKWYTFYILKNII